MLAITTPYTDHADLGAEELVAAANVSLSTADDELMLTLDYYPFLRGVLRIAEPRRLMSWIRSCS